MSFRSLLLAMFLATLIVVADYYVSNMSFPLLDSSTDLTVHAFMHDFRMNDDIINKIFPVNTAKDKELAISYDVFGREEGRVAVSDRGKIADFLQKVRDAQYRYIFLDVRFEENIVTPHDSILYATILEMPRLVYSRHQSMQEDEPVICSNSGKGAFADYRSTVNAGFSRYEFLQDGKESVALRLFHDINGRTITTGPFGSFQDSDGSLCYNMQFIPFPANIAREYSADGEILYPLLGSQIMDQHSDEELRRMVNDKIIVIGDFENDQHDTYVGSVPGPLLSVYAWNLMAHDGHKLNCWLQLGLWMFYTVVLFIILLPDERKSIRSPFLSLVLSILGWGFTLWVLKSLMYWLLGLSFIITIPALVFSTLEFIKSITKKPK